MGRKRKHEEVTQDIRQYIYELYTKEDVSPNDLAQRFSLKPDMIWRIIREERKAEQP